MERVFDLTPIVEREIANYVWDQDDSKAYLMKNEAHQIYGVLVIPVNNPQDSQTIIVAHIEGNKIVIDTDLTDKPLYKALINAGVPDNQVVRAYAQPR